MTRATAYLDWAATAPLAQAARAAMDAAAARIAAGEWANPSSAHGPGRAARRALEEARARIAAALHVPADAIIFTSGGTEALALAMDGAGPGTRLVGATEHAAVREAAPEAQRIAVDACGRIDMDSLAALLSGARGAAVVAVQHASNETGVVQDLDAIGALVHRKGGLLIADCVQTAAKLPLPARADAIAVSAHKLGGPAGVGALILRCRDDFRPVRRGGGQEGGWRGGTENLLGIVGFAAALDALETGWTESAARLQARLEAEVMRHGARINGAGAERLATISSIHLPGLPAATQLMALDLAGVAVSQGPACSSGTLRPSEALLAMGLEEAAEESLRISTGWTTRDEDIERFLAAWTPLAARARGRSASAAA
jgi:cysteine desulfurase